MVLAVVGLYVFGVAFLIYSKRWQAFGRKISIAAALLIGLGVFQHSISGVEFWALAGSISDLARGYAVDKCGIFPERCRLFEWLRVYSPARLFALEQIIERRFFSPSVSSALVHGVLCGALLLGLSEAGRSYRESNSWRHSFFRRRDRNGQQWVAHNYGNCFSFMVGLISRVE